MDPNAVTSNALAAPVGTAPPPADLSMLTLFLQADVIVKVIMIILLVASFWSWAVIFDKWLKLRRLRKEADSFEENFWSGGSIDTLYDRIGSRPTDPMAAVFSAAMLEWRRAVSKGVLGGTGGFQASLKERIEKIMVITIGREMERLERFTAFLATVGSTAPFVGLFGTVWGIMNSFQSIAQTKNTSLAVVAPGIAEALFTTALGLVAAIPAVIGYNKITTDFGRYANRLDSFAGEFSAILSRQLEDRN
jgi:biopolymer transport protein TolQ